MSYKKTIENLVEKVDPELIDFDSERERNSPPTQVSSEFLTNKEQGDWAESTLLNAINNNTSKYIAVKYGRDDNIIAGEDGFKDFYEAYQDELDEIGKRPDILIFDKNDFEYDTKNISNYPRSILDDLVPKAKCGIEVRSSAFVSKNYDEFMIARQNVLFDEAENIIKTLTEDYSVPFKNKKPDLYNQICSISRDNYHDISYRTPSWKNGELKAVSSLLKDLNSILRALNTRTYLSITPKMEDLKVVYTWIQKYNVPHFYVQVFFDKAYGISFNRILKLTGSPELQNKEYFIEKDVKNQNKTTIKINANKGEKILDNIELPEHYSQQKELGRGRLLFYVRFKESLATLNHTAFKSLFGFEL